MKTFTSPEDLAVHIQYLDNVTTPFVIAIDGYGGSGKSTLGKALKQLLPSAMIIETDNFIKYPHEPNVFEHDWLSIERNVLSRLKNDEKVVTKEYDWNTLSPIKEIQQIKDFVIVEGISLLDDRYVDYYDLKIWIDCPYEVALERGKKRDKEEQGTNHDELWDTVWGPGSKRYFQRSRPDLKADVLFKTN